MNVRRCAAELSRQHGTNDPFELCDRLNIKFLHWPLEDMRGYFYQNENGRIIVLNTNLKPWEDRFVCAHEIGHFLLHGGFNRVFLDSRTFLNPSRYEKEANEFGMYLLFPEDSVLLEYGDTVQTIAANIGLSEDLVSLRFAQVA